MNEYTSEPLDHEGHARCVIAKYPGLYKYTPSHGWLFYNGSHWQRQGAEASLGRAIVTVLRERLQFISESFADDPDADKKIGRIKKLCAANSYVVAGIRARLMDQSEIQSQIDDFDNDIWALNCANGVVNLRTGAIETHCSSQLFTYCLEWDYKPDAVCDDWLDFLTDSAENGQMADYLQLVAGYALTGDISEECLFYIFGPSRSGKGTFTETLNYLMGPLSEGLNFKTFTAERMADTQNFDLAPLKNMRLVIASESRRNERMNEAVLKQVTGGDKIWCAHKGKPHFSYRPQYKIILTSNHPANADAQDTAAWGRLRVIHFPNSKLGNEDRGLKQRLREKDAIEGVLAWAIAGAIDWAENGLPVMEEIAELTRRQRLEANTVGLFVDQCCSFEENAFTPGTPLYKAYKEWAKDEGYQPFGRKSFTIALSELGIVTDRKRFDGKLQRGFVGIEFSGVGLGDETISKALAKVSQNGNLSHGLPRLPEVTA